MSDIVQKLWGFCHTLRHEGIDYGDYIEQLTYLLFLKMADERSIDLSQLKFAVEKDGKTQETKFNCSWPNLVAKSGTALRDHYFGYPTHARPAAGHPGRHLRGRSVTLQ